MSDEDEATFMTTQVNISKPLCHHGEISFTAVRHECNLRVFWLVVVASEGRLLVRFRW